MRVLTLYSKAGCHLCDDMQLLAARAAAAAGVQLDIVDITSDPALFAQYRYDIPVLRLEGHEIARHRTTEAAIAHALDQGATGT